ncbi:NADPH2:quinone reductase [Candidatus Kinetoplastibacterium oncopeltii TCC290E]|uniref:NADPH2:quinone reductase n=1 Tax=Candidatus Kinetoplastidibacterium stringomonadis TCC290E TaxID=1208920 RepID=M1LSG6_9PROT|nr:NAD(P)H-quinone oxidoreductase [Candidatus Kinetoplastibacterium oncopeltii]AGF48497.1 NADPH2:quinone reductase [Candidatus Kinetoplastibacterium oncopeltii TCC290E]
MKAIEITKFGGPEVLSIVDRSIPEIKSGEVLIKVAAAGINRPDIFQRQGLYKPPYGASDIPGLEVSGEIVSGDAKLAGLSIGDKVCALISGGGYAQYCVANVEHCLPIPINVSSEDSAGLPEALFTSWSNLVDKGNIKEGESLLIHGGSSGVGVMAIQLANSLGCDVYATAGSPRKVSFVESIGAIKCINYRSEDFVSEINKITEGNGVNIILDMVSGSYFDRNLSILSKGGRLLIIALLGGVFSTINSGYILKKNLLITGSMLRTESILFKHMIARSLRKFVWPLLSSGEIKPITYSYIPFEEVIEAHRLMESGEHIGKIILVM